MTSDPLVRSHVVFGCYPLARIDGTDSDVLKIARHM